VRLDYAQTTELLRTLTDVRFKLLAVVPTISGVAVALLGHGRTAAELLTVGAVGLVATLGILVYELRNTQIYDYALDRAAALESRLGMVSVFGSRSGRLFSERPGGRTVRLFGLTAVGHDRGLSLVYGVALAAWSYLVAWGALRAFDVGSARPLGAGIGLIVGLVVMAELLRSMTARPSLVRRRLSRAPALTAPRPFRRTRMRPAKRVTSDTSFAPAARLGASRSKRVAVQDRPERNRRPVPLG